MKYLIFFGISFIVLWVLYSLNVQYEWVELQFGWSKVAIGIAAAGGPLEYLRNKVIEKKEETQNIETDLKFRTLKHTEFLERERTLQKKVHVTDKSEEKPVNENDDFKVNEPTFG